MPQDEKLAFAARLKAALKRSAKGVATPTELAIQFSLRHPNEPITPQAAQKWLTGKARPRPDKMETLAEWLEVPAHWLSYGPPKPTRRKAATQARQTGKRGDAPLTLSAAEAKWVLRLRSLSAHQQDLLLELADQLALEREIARGEG
ncbi:MAG: transcriptional regulator [Rhodocyclales bacterium]|nr:transcriptional regulator [Rhodocyclales bacterium]